MPRNFDEHEQAWASELTTRLRQIQSDFSDDAHEERQNYIREEIQFHLESVPADKRLNYLLALEEQFPIFEGVEEEDEAEGAQPEINPMERLMAAFEIVAANLEDLPEEERQRLKPKPTGTTAPPFRQMAMSKAGVTEELSRALGIPTDARVDNDRYIMLLTKPVRLILDFNLLLAGALKELEGNPRQQTDLKSGLKAALLDENIDEAAVTEMLDSSRRQMALLINDFGGVGKTFSQRVLNRIRPSVIEGEVGSNRKKCWEKYVELSADLTGNAVEREIRSIISRYLQQAST